MSETPAGTVGIEERESKSREAKSREAGPPSSAPRSSSPVPPPPAQVVAALEEFEIAGPESFRRSFPEIAAKLETPVSFEAKGAAPARTEVHAEAASRATKLKVAIMMAAATLIVGVMWALFSK
jgi:hypothetical protein